ncbi:MAG: fructosamine kinase family protein [Gemmatimonadales bacterium]|nr:MAG: fructosamine kinase family protein [Gemmatimonadales bacterium]
MRGSFPAEVRIPLEEALASACGTSVVLGEHRSASGGCIHNALVVESSAGTFFVKWNRGPDGAGFTSEGRALQWLRRAADHDRLVSVPDVVVSKDAEGDAPGWLVLEYLPPARPGPGYSRSLGEGLARIHARGSELAYPLGDREATAETRNRSRPTSPAVASPSSGVGRSRKAFGWFEDNRIGTLVQTNPWMDDWTAFWREARLRPNLEAASRSGALGPRARDWTEPLLDAVEPALAPVCDAAPALVHGDLWSGNVHPGPDGRPVLVDPASYLGHGEVDLAMARLFGGFDADTFHSYQAVLPSPDGFEQVRLHLYQLYYLLVHVRLFGSSYLASSRRAAEAVIRTVL